MKFLMVIGLIYMTVHLAVISFKRGKKAATKDSVFNENVQLR